MRRATLPLALVAASGALVLVSVTVGVDGPAHRGDSPDVAAASGSPSSSSGSSSTTLRGARTVAPSSLDTAIVAAQKRLARVPDDSGGWAQLGAAYVQQGRITSDPSYYPKAESALKRSLSLTKDAGTRAGSTATADTGSTDTGSTDTADVDALVGMGSLANARHEFARALTWGRRAQALDPYDAGAYAVIDDALTQLGDYAGADVAVQRMLDLSPGVSSFTRASYHFEERGQVVQARSALMRALEDASDPADIAFCRAYLGELAFNGGDPSGALTQYAQGLAVDPTFDPLLAGRARALAALGRTDEAVRDYATVVGRVPLPQYVLEYGELLQSLGRDADARTQYALLAAEQKLFAAAGVVDDLMAATYEADHGDADAAVRHARLEWKRRHSVLVADALAWALHRAGRDAEALPYAVAADRLGWRNATFAYHRGMIEVELGRTADARAHLSEALTINPHFSPLAAPVARTALAALSGAE